MDREELIELITKVNSEIIEGIVMKLKNESCTSITKGYLNQNEAIKYLGISKPTFLKIKHNFPEYTLSEGRLGYKAVELDKYAESKK